MRIPRFDAKMTERGKRCSRCLAFKTFDQFSPDNTGRGGRQSICKLCCVQKNKSRRGPRHAEYQRAKANGKARKDRAYYDANRPAILVRTAAWRETRREIIRE